MQNPKNAAVEEVPQNMFRIPSAQKNIIVEVPPKV